MSISPLALAAKRVIDAAFVNGPAYDLASVAAFALESACLLQDPETAAEHDLAVETARHAVAVAESSVAMMRREHAENARLRARLAEYERQAVPGSSGLEVPETALGKVQAILLMHFAGGPRPDVAVGLLLANLRAEWEAEERARTADLEAAPVGGGYPPALPWARLMDDDDLAEFLLDLKHAVIDHDDAAKALADVESTCGTWRLIAEAQHAHNTAPGPDVDEPVDALTRLLAPTQALREDEDPCHPCGCPKRFARHADGCPTYRQATGCGDGPDDWCGGCSACKCEPHAKGCVKASAPR